MSNIHELQSALSEIAISDTSLPDKGTAYVSLLDQILTGDALSVVSNLKAFLNAILDNSVSPVASRPALDKFSQTTLDAITNADAKKEIGNFAIDKIEDRVHFFEEQDSTIRLKLAEIYENEEENFLASKILRAIKLESSQRQVKDEDKVEIYIRIMRNLLEIEDTTTAETYLNRATSIIHKCSNPVTLIVFNMCQARIQDAKRQFLTASQKYHSLSMNTKLAEEERANFLGRAITCAILAPAGPQRSRALATLYKDERTEDLGDLRVMLEKMFLDRLLSPQEVSDFAKRLDKHQLATLSDGTTVLSKAVVEHNLLGASKIYKNIGVEELGVLLGLDGEKAEQYAAGMIEQKRLRGRIDGIAKLIYFDAGREVEVTVPAIAGEDAKKGEKIDGDVEKQEGWKAELRAWDERIWGVAQGVENIVTGLQNEYPVCFDILSMVWSFAN